MTKVLDVGTKVTYGMNYDPVIIRRYVGGKHGGAVLDVSDYTEEYIKAGQVVIKDANGILKPMPITSGAYGTLPTGCSYYGIVVTTCLASEPLTGILTAGEVNDKCLPYDISTILTAFKAAVPTIVFDHD